MSRIIRVSWILAALLADDAALMIAAKASTQRLYSAVRWDGRGVKDFQELKVWQKAHELTLAVYRVTAAFPREELYGLISQLRRACSSVAANLAEGCRRNGDAEFARFCSIAMGSASELEYHLLLARRFRSPGPPRHRTETHADRAAAKAER